MKLTYTESRQLLTNRFDTKQVYLDGDIEVYSKVETNGQITAMAFIRKQGKPVWHYMFRKAEQFEATVNRLIESVTLSNEYRTKRDAEAKARAEQGNPFQVGDMLTASWGYEQTNRDFYQVVEVKPKSVVVRPIAGEMVEATGSMSGNMKPIKDDFCGEPKLCKVDFRTSTPVVKVEYGHASKVEEGRSYYCSWYG